MDHQLKQLQDWISESRHIVFFGGAGVSTESGIPDFRSVDGLYHQQYAFPPETILSHSFFERNPEEFYRFYRSKMLFPQAQAQCSSLETGGAGGGGKADRRCDSEHRRAPPGGGEQNGVRAPRLRPPGTTA